MTAIVGLTDGKTVWIGGDSAGCSGSDLSVRADPKVFRNGEFVFGFTSSFRMGQLLRYKFTPPKHRQDQDIFEYMATAFVDGIRQCLKDGGFAKKENETESGGTFLIGYCGRLFAVEGDYQVMECADQYDAVGCGANIARGALFASADSAISPEVRVLLALRAAERHTASVRGPFRVETTPTTA